MEEERGRKLVVVAAESDALMLDTIMRANQDIARVLTVPPPLLAGYDMRASDSISVFSLFARAGRGAALALVETALSMDLLREVMRKCRPPRKSKGWRRHVRRVKAAKRRSQ